MSSDREIAYFTALGACRSKANSRRIVENGGKKRVIKSDSARAFEEAFAAQCPRLKEPTEDDVAVWVRIYYDTLRPDLDESLVLDGMQGRIYANDRQVKEKHIFHALDRERPRVVVRVMKLV